MNNFDLEWLMMSKRQKIRDIILGILLLPLVSLLIFATVSALFVGVLWLLSNSVGVGFKW